jgi:hypothetical protein
LVLAKHWPARVEPDRQSKREPDLGNGSSNGPGNNEPERPTAYTSNNPVKAANITGHKEIGMFLQSMVFLDIKDEPTG